MADIKIVLGKCKKTGKDFAVEARKEGLCH